MELNDGSVDVNFKQIKRCLNKIRTQSLPKCPKTPIEVQKCFENELFLENYGMSRQKDQQFYKHTILENSFSYTVFMASKIVDLINSNFIDYESRKFFIDGTFNIVPTSTGLQTISFRV